MLMQIHFPTKNLWLNPRRQFMWNCIGTFYYDRRKTEAYIVPDFKIKEKIFVVPGKNLPIRDLDREIGSWLYFRNASTALPHSRPSTMALTTRL